MNFRKNFVIIVLFLIINLFANINAQYTIMGVAQAEIVIVKKSGRFVVKSHIYAKFTGNVSGCEEIKDIREVVEKNIVIKKYKTTLSVKFNVLISLHRIYIYNYNIYNWLSLFTYMTLDILDCIIIIYKIFQIEPPKIMIEIKAKIKTLTCFLPESDAYFQFKFCLLVRMIKRILIQICYYKYYKRL